MTFRKSKHFFPAFLFILITVIAVHCKLKPYNGDDPRDNPARFFCEAYGLCKPAEGNPDIFSIEMVSVPPLSFPTGTDDLGTATVTAGFQLATTEVTYALWITVYTWATVGDGGVLDEGEAQYTFANPGLQGGDQSGCAAAVGTTNLHPVTCMDWRDAIVWLNALTEYSNSRNGTSVACVYNTDPAYGNPLRSSYDAAYINTMNLTPGGFDNPYVNSNARGFRLPTADEWELAARYKGGDSANGAIEHPPGSGLYWTPGSYASGATADYTDLVATDTVAVVGASTTAVVKSKAANALQIYDLSGNVEEWIFDWHPSYPDRRITRGGVFDSSATFAQIGLTGAWKPYDESYAYGFRPARNE